MIGTGEPLARALEKIEAYANRVPMDIDPAHATAYIINPLTGRKVQFASFFRSHPPTEDRVARLTWPRPTGLSPTEAVSRGSSRTATGMPKSPPCSAAMAVLEVVALLAGYPELVALGL